MNATQGNPGIQDILAASALVKAKRLRRIALMLACSSYGLALTALCLMLVLDPPIDGSEVTAFQHLCMALMVVAEILGLIAFIVSAIGVLKRDSRKLMWLPFAVSSLPAVGALAVLTLKALGLW